MVWGMTCLHSYFRAFQTQTFVTITVMTIMISIGGILVAFLTICFIHHHLSQHHVVVCCLLFVVCCLLLVVCCLLPGCWLSVVGCLIHSSPSSFNIKPQAHRIERHFHHAALHDLGYLDPIGVEFYNVFFFWSCFLSWISK